MTREKLISVTFQRLAEGGLKETHDRRLELQAWANLARNPEGALDAYIAALIAAAHRNELTREVEKKLYIVHVNLAAFGEGKLADFSGE